MRPCIPQGLCSFARQVGGGFQRYVSRHWHLTCCPSPCSSVHHSSRCSRTVGHSHRNGRPRRGETSVCVQLPCAAPCQELAARSMPRRFSLYNHRWCSIDPGGAAATSSWIFPGPAHERRRRRHGSGGKGSEKASEQANGRDAVKTVLFLGLACTPSLTARSLPPATGHGDVPYNTSTCETAAASTVELVPSDPPTDGQGVVIGREENQHMQLWSNEHRGRMHA